MKISTEQIQKDIDYLSVFLEDKEQIDEVIGACDKLGIGSAEYFCEEFVFIPDGQEPGKNGKFIICPICEQGSYVFHFAWSALQCQHCDSLITKRHWKVTG